jgi:hypothetical protein
MEAVADATRFLAQEEWCERRHRHEARVRGWIEPHQKRAARGEKHPVHDFLFNYYAFRPAWLRRWHPGPDVILGGEAAREFLRWPEYGEVRLSESGTGVPPVISGNGFDRGPNIQPAVAVMIDCAALPPRRREFVGWLEQLLTGMQTRPAFFACHGMHEWAMVYRQNPEELRHAGYPLRFSPERIAEIVEATPPCCSHFDAFRFFTPPARPLNKLQPERADALRLEQRGCLHANMDLYKWAFKLAPFTPSELIADCFELARDVREIDMRASPYDLRALGYEPIAIETAAGRAEYEQHQRAFASRGEPLRARLIALAKRLREAWET